MNSLIRILDVMIGVSLVLFMNNVLDKHLTCVDFINRLCVWH